jgi:AcrR family transcriptional regulator
MVQKGGAPPGERVNGPPAKKSRGRPRAYDPAQALAGARDAFWQLGFSGASLDLLSDATDMNRPSMYAAFGDKHALYVQTLEKYIAEATATMTPIMTAQVPLATALTNMYEAALAMYLPQGAAPRGCYLIGTAATEAVTDEKIRAVLAGGLRSFDKGIRWRMQRAQREGDLPATVDVDSLAILASALLHTLAIRSRYGESRATLRTIIASGVKTLCGTPSKTRSRKASR